MAGMSITEKRKQAIAFSQHYALTSNYFAVSKAVDLPPMANDVKIDLSCEDDTPAWTWRGNAVRRVAQSDAPLHRRCDRASGDRRQRPDSVSSGRVSVSAAWIICEMRSCRSWSLKIRIVIVVQAQACSARGMICGKGYKRLQSRRTRRRRGVGLLANWKSPACFYTHARSLCSAAAQFDRIFSLSR